MAQWVIGIKLEVINLTIDGETNPGIECDNKEETGPNAGVAGTFVAKHEFPEKSAMLGV